MAEGPETLRDCSGELCQLPSQGQLTIVQSNTQTPDGNVGSFSFQPFNHPELYYPEHSDLRPRAPADEETGVPIPIAPYLDMEHLSNHDTNIHHAVYPKTHPLLQSLGGRALRVARMQIVPHWLHNGSDKSAYHTIFGNGITVPSLVEEQVGLVALMVAGYMPEQVVDTTGGEPLVRVASNEERAYLVRTLEVITADESKVDEFWQTVMPEANRERAKRVLTILNEKDAVRRYRFVYFGASQVKAFLVDFVLSQDLSVFNQNLMKKFISQGEPEIGMTLLGQASAAAVKCATVKGRSLDDVYRDMRARNLLNAKLSPRPADFMIGTLGTHIGRASLMPVFREGLSTAYEQVA